MTSFPLISDLHKDARGFRPSADFMAHFKALAHDAQQAIWDGLCAELEITMADERAAKERAAAAFEARVTATIDAGARDRATAIRWIIDAEGQAEDVAYYGMGSLCYHLGLAYDYFNEREAA